MYEIYLWPAGESAAEVARDRAEQRSTLQLDALATLLPTRVLNSILGDRAITEGGLASASDTPRRLLAATTWRETAGRDARIPAAERPTAIALALTDVMRADRLSDGQRLPLAAVKDLITSFGSVRSNPGLAALIPELVSRVSLGVEPGRRYVDDARDLLRTLKAVDVPRSARKEIVAATGQVQVFGSREFQRAAERAERALAPFAAESK
jgi:hypothetical protein